MSEMGDKWDRYAQLIAEGKTVKTAYAGAFNDGVTLSQIASKIDPDLISEVYIYLDGFRVAIAGAVFEHEFVHGRDEDPNKQIDGWNVQLNHDWAVMNDIPKLYRSFGEKTIRDAVEGVKRVIKKYNAEPGGKRCDVCGEKFGPNDERGEFVDNGKHVVAHSECGLTNGLSIA